MKKFFSKKKNIVILSIILAILIIAAGIIFAVNNYNKKQAQVNENNQKAIITKKAETEILGENKEEDTNEYEEKYTKEYEEYLELSDEEKEETQVVPKKYEVNYTVINNIIEEQKKDTKTDTKKKDSTDTDSDIDYEFVTPKKYNLADKISIQTEDQGSYGLCWDFAATKCLETNLALTKKKNYDFSEMHVNYVTSTLLIGDREIDDGGNFSIYEDYLIDSGVVLEDDVEYKDYNSEEYNTFLDMQSVATVTKTVNFPTIYKYEGSEITDEQILTVRNAVKNHIMNYGSIYAQIAMGDYDYDTNNLYTTADSDSFIDHAVTIVGWDDNYSKDNFASDNKPKSDGAYIALNSWGDGFGDNGYFYISYEDYYVESGMSGIISTSYEDAYNLDDIENEYVKDYIVQRLSNTIKQNEEDEYVTELALSKITYVDFSDTDITSLEDIELFNNLYGLNLAKTDIKSVKKLANLAELCEIDLSDTKVTDVSSLSNLEELMILNLSNDENIKGYEKLEELVNLNLSNCNITDVSNLKDNKNLEVIDLSKNDNVKNLSNLTNLTSLTYENGSLTNLNDILKLTNLYTLSVAYNNISDISGIEKLGNLYVLDLSGNNVKDFSSINLINNEEDNDEEEYYPYITLIVEDANITDISLFNGLKNVSSLDLAKNNITDLSGFYNNYVYELDLSNNTKLYNFQYLRNSENLYSLYLSGCNIEDLSEISKLADKIEILDLSNNNITNIDVLNEFNLYALSLAGDDNISGSLKSDNLYILNLEDTKYDSQLFNFDKCSILSQLNISNSQDADVINELIQNTQSNNLYYIVLGDTELTKELLENLLEKEITTSGGNLNIVELSDYGIVDEEDSINFKDSSILKNIIRSSLWSREVTITGGRLYKNQTQISKEDEKSGTITIGVSYGYYMSDLTIKIEYSDTEVEEEETIDTTNEIINETDNQSNEITNTIKNNTNNENSEYTMTED